MKKSLRIITWVVVALVVGGMLLLLIVPLFY